MEIDLEVVGHNNNELTIHPAEPSIREHIQLGFLLPESASCLRKKTRSPVDWPRHLALN